MDLNEYIKFLKNSSEYKKVNLIYDSKEFSSQDLILQINERIVLAKKCINEWRIIIQKSLEENQPHILTGNIGELIYNSIFNALIKEDYFTQGYSRKSINKNEDLLFLNKTNELLDNLIKILNYEINTINDFNFVIVEVKKVFNNDYIYE